MLTFESDSIAGATAIVEKLGVRPIIKPCTQITTNFALLLQSLPFQQVKHVVSTLDAQPAGLDGSAILILVTGQLLVRGNDRAGNTNADKS